MTALYIIFGLLILLIAIMAINTIRKKPPTTAEQKTESIVLDEAAFAKNLSGMIRFKTITSDTMEGFDRKEFLDLHKYLEETYPLLHRTMEKEVVNEYSLLYHWKGTGSNRKPFLMMAHMDVVPVEEGTADTWPHPAFSGDIAEGYVWGRGTIDMKGQLAAIFDSIEYLIGKGFKPKRDIYLALGHDEEAMGRFGAISTVERLKEKGIRFDFVIDEGGMLLNGSIMGINAMVATIGVCEKGYADFKLTAKSEGGHASRPPHQTAVGALAKAIVAIQKHPMKSVLSKTLRDMLNVVGGYMKFPLNVIAANLFITKPILLAGLASGSTGAAMVRTTAAPTMLKGSAAPNVLADRAEAVINARIMPGQTVEDVKKHFEKVTRGLVEISIIQGYNPSAISSTDNEAYRVIAHTVREVFSNYLISPYLMIAATDSRLYAPVSDNVYLFQPFRSLNEDLGTLHAVGERLSIQSLREGVEFFIRLVKNADE